MMVRLLLACMIVTALFVGLRWSLMPVLAPPQGLYSGTQVDLIHARYPRSLVDPASLGGSEDDVSFAWIAAEVKARGMVVLTVAAVLIGAVVASRWMRKRKITANQVPEDTARKLADPQH